MNDFINLAVNVKPYDFLIWGGNSIQDLFILLMYLFKMYFRYD